MQALKDKKEELTYAFRTAMNNLFDAKWDRDPFGSAPHASRDEYLKLFEEARAQEYEPVRQVEQELGFAVDRIWLDALALHTQIVKKRSQLSYPHGRLLYSVLRRYIEDSGERFITILETGTARGFSALCMAKALDDAGVDGRIITIDVLPHLKPQIWNCIDDHDGRKSRAELLAPWADLARRIVFLQGDTLSVAPKVGLDRIHFAFLDAQHTQKAVLNEYSVVAPRQKPGDLIFFDDVTPAMFPGVVAAVASIEASAAYALRRLTISDQRAYAWGAKRA